MAEPSLERGTSAGDVGRGRFLRMLRPDPGIDDFEELCTRACDPDAVDYPAACRPPADWSKAPVWTVAPTPWLSRDDDAHRECLERIIEVHGGRFASMELQGIRDFRQELLDSRNQYEVGWLLRLLARPEHCDPSIYARLIRMLVMRERMC